MKKSCFALTLALILALACVSAQAAQYDPINFGDFSMAIDPDMPYQQLSEEKTDGGAIFVLYPVKNDQGQIDPTVSFNVVWQSQPFPFINWDESYRDSYVSMLRSQFEAMLKNSGLTLLDFSMPNIEKSKLDGVDALAQLMIVSYEYAGQQISLYEIQAIATIDGIGTYVFTGSAPTLAVLEANVAPLFDAITWN